MRVKLGDIASIKHGFAFSGESICEEDNGIVLVTPGNFSIGGGFQEEKCKFYTGEIPRDYVLSPGDLIVTMTDLSKGIDTLGYGALVPFTGRIYLHNQRIGLVEIKDSSVDKGYLARVLQTREYQKTIAGTSSGSTVHHTSPSKIESYSFELPDLKTQRRIAGVLSAYDELIENSCKQIKLLEEAAQRLYKKWFVDLKFPGYETTAIRNGLPEGWRYGKLGDVVEFKRGKTITQKETTEGDVPVVAGGLEPAYYHNVANTGRPVITVSGSGANAGFCRLYTTEIWASDCSFADQHMTDNLLFVYLSIRVLSNGFRQCQRGSAQPHVYPKHVNALKILIPDSAVLTRFEHASEPFFSLIGAAERQIAVAREARSRLLPKLMSGEIEV